MPTLREQGPGETPDVATPPREAEIPGAAFDQSIDWQKVSAGANGGIIEVFRDYDRLVECYGDLPKVGSEIKAHVEKLRHQPEYAAVLNELAAESLWQLGQKHERDDRDLLCLLGLQACGRTCARALGPTGQDSI